MGSQASLLDRQATCAPWTVIEESQSKFYGGFDDLLPRVLLHESAFRPLICANCVELKYQNSVLLIILRGVL